MKYFLDTEFHEYHKQSKCLGIPIGKTIPTIDLISIGIVSEDIEKTLMPPMDTYNETVKTDREYYAVSKDFNIKDAWYSWQSKKHNLSMGIIKEYWLRKNVLKSIFRELLIIDGNKKNIIVKKYYRYSTNGVYLNEMIINEIEEKSFNLKNFTRLINKYGKTNKQIAEEIKEFIAQDDNNYKDLRKKIILSSRTLGKNLRIRNILLEYNNLKFDNPEFYAYYADYDWVVFCQLFGKMIDLPKGFPMYCNDLKQLMNEKVNVYDDGFMNNNESFNSKLKSIKNKDNYPKQYNKHNALDDAKWNKKLYKFLNNI